ncbi:hypothetical protein OMP44_14585 [Pseudomonas sp. CBMAI 2609]|uniref:Restriction endonuclease type IV Mrr domain-containing protein n=1 Tax=Pseudomonas flavocrustae TaxID=2991719 RepID=A0ABT6II49_9PSED|nr:hypothetical protein [Pseudomonas sp. CBMAI 2609]MDH4764121.1 hypothetical protein [Pseudomonas sp. CBMAI 2609]
MSRREVRDYLFNEGDASSSISAQISTACTEVSTLPERRILEVQPEALLAYFLEKYGVEVPALVRDGIVASHHERQVEIYDRWDKQIRLIPGEAYDFEVPFVGEGDIFKLRPSTFDFNPPRAVIRKQYLAFTISGRTLRAEEVKAELDSTLASIEKYLESHRRQWAGFQQQLSIAVKAEIDSRRTKLLAQKENASRLSDLGIRLKEKEGSPRTYIPPAVKQKVVPQLPPMSPAIAPEPTLDMKQYETILGLVRGAGRSIEQSSSRTRKLDEESLRDLFLVPLNAHFGTATGEAFNYQGKTDVLIRHQQGNLFVAEFKVWRGDKNFLATIDQLLSYLTWRDTKTAIVIFNRNADFTSVVDKIRTLVKLHPRYLSGPISLDETSDRYTFFLPQDSGRKVLVSILAFDLSTGP